jgi:NAD(P)-dependent dehydrogenase (short-subunit alcohol dehydrogenase family)
MTGRIEGRVAVVTGGASGIGRASAMRFVEEGARVVIADCNETSAREALGLAGDAARDRLRFVRCDVAEEGDVAAAVDTALREFGRLDCMFNNAGLPGALGPLTDVTVDAWDRTFAVLVRGVFLGIKHGARAMRATGGGTIINTGSIAAFSAGAGPAAYSACKSAVVALTRSAAVELAPATIRVNALCPGLVLTPLLDRGKPTELASVLGQAQPWPEAGLPEHIAAVALFLASDDSRFVTGEALLVDGGITARGPGVFARDNPVGMAIAKSISEGLRTSGVTGPIGFDPGTAKPRR